MKKALTLSYTSSDESDLSESEGGQLILKGYLVKPLPWERSALRRKLQRRLETLEKSNTDRKRKDKMKKALTLSYTSSDESDLSESEGGQLILKGYLVKPLPWERSALRRAPSSRVVRPPIIIANFSCSSDKSI
ncbi:hypothetical protein QZH41_007596 [Actinostola sp. cb2023]|nr:hypothetical protein QZH41_007596 [Actinostola sp. cb2023]